LRRSKPIAEESRAEVCRFTFAVSRLLIAEEGRAEVSLSHYRIITLAN
jgi:hypothetical protein